jgi:hypothetical protein
MLQIYVNNVRQELVPSPTTWGELLDMLDAKAANDGTILSVARFDGVEEPSFREPDVVSRALNDVTRVEVKTAVPSEFLRECLIDTLEPLEECASAAVGLAAIYRRHDLSQGHEALAQLAANLHALMTIASMLDGPIGVELGAEEQMVELGNAIDALVTAQSSEDWLTVADTLEYDLEPAIRRWTAIVTGIINQLQ